MKYLLLALLIFFIFWYYKKKRGRSRVKNRSLEVEMISCPKCGTYFSIREGKALRFNSNSLLFCSESCLREFIQSKESRRC